MGIQLSTNNDKVTTSSDNSCFKHAVLLVLLVETFDFCQIHLLWLVFECLTYLSKIGGDTQGLGKL